MGTQCALHTTEYVDLLVLKELSENARSITLRHPQMELPAVAALLTLPNGTSIAVASIHLPHTAEAASLRKNICQSIMQSMQFESTNVILLGDFNMRQKEDAVIESLVGGEWIDAWKEVTNSDAESKFTWNGRENKYHGPENFQFTARFDRCYARGEKFELTHFDLIGNQPVNGRKEDYLSDHYGLVVKCNVVSSDSPNENRGERKRRLQSDAVVDLSIDDKLREDDDETKVNNKYSIHDRIDKKRNCDNMVDLTGDSDDDDEEGAVVCKNTAAKTSNGGTQKDTINGSDKVGIDELRALRLKRFAGPGM